MSLLTKKINLAYLKQYAFHREYKQIMNLQDLPTFEEMLKNVSLVIGNSHFSEGVIRPMVPAYVEVGGIQVKPEPAPLDKDLEAFLAKSSEHGTIFFSMGSNIKISNLDPEIIRVLYNALSNVKQSVVWKWENSSQFPGDSKRIFSRNWLPQDDILAHQNVKLFITHGGKGSIVESQFHGVPMIGLPVFGDQPINVKTMVNDGFGLELDYQSMSEDDFRKAIDEVINNRTFANNVQKFSKIYRDRPISARDTAVYWIEYVIRHHGAPHLQSPLVHSNVIVQYSLDVLCFLFLVLFIFVKFAKILVCFIIKTKFITFRKTFLKCKQKSN